MASTVNRFAQETFDFVEDGFFFRAAEGNSQAFLLGAAGAAHAVDVVFGHLGEVVIHHLIHIGDIDPPGADVGGNQDFHGPFAELLHDVQALELVFVAVDGDTVDSGAFEGLAHAFGPDLGADKYQNLAVGIFLDQAGKEKPLVVHFDEGDGMSDIPGDRVVGRNLDANRVFDQRIG